MARPRKEPLTENQKIAKAIGPDAEDILKELEAADTEELNKRIAQASQAISDTKEELNQNPEYVQAKEDVKLLSSGLSEVKKRQNAIIKVCLNLRRDRGAV
jgi:predicted translin family RNA/ssDNA-binding protein